MSEPSAPKPIPSSRRLRMADQNRACRLLREAIPGDVSRRALSWRVVWLRADLLSHGAGRAAQPEHCVLYERWILVTQRESLSQSRESLRVLGLSTCLYIRQSFCSTRLYYPLHCTLPLARALRLSRVLS